MLSDAALLGSGILAIMASIKLQKNKVNENAKSAYGLLVGASISSMLGFAALTVMLVMTMFKDKGWMLPPGCGDFAMLMQNAMAIMSILLLLLSGSLCAVAAARLRDDRKLSRDLDDAYRYSSLGAVIGMLGGIMVAGSYVATNLCRT